MKICISSTGNNLDSTIDPRFGRCPFFLIVDSENSKFEAVANPGANLGGGAGIAAAQLVASHGVEAVISGNIGPNALGVLQSAKIKIFTGVFDITAKQALEDLKNNKIIEASQLTGPNLMGRSGRANGGAGRGGKGRGMGRR